MLTHKIKLSQVYFLFLCSGLLSYQSCKQVTADGLFAANFHPFPNVLVDLEQDSLSANPRVLTFLSYRNKNYAEALLYSDKIDGLSSTDPIQLYRGVCQMALGKIDAAKSILTHLVSKPSEYKDAAYWYLALCALKQNNLTETQAHLKQLTNRSTYIRNEAEVLLNQVRAMNAGS